MGWRSRLSPDWPLHPHTHPAPEARLPRSASAPLCPSMLATLHSQGVLFPLLGLLKSHPVLDPLQVQTLILSPPILSSCPPPHLVAPSPRMWPPGATSPPFRPLTPSLELASRAVSGVCWECSSLSAVPAAPARLPPCTQVSAQRYTLK